MVRNSIFSGNAAEREGAPDGYNSFATAGGCAITRVRATSWASPPTSARCRTTVRPRRTGQAPRARSSTRRTPPRRGAAARPGGENDRAASCGRSGAICDMGAVETSCGDGVENPGEHTDGNATDGDSLPAELHSPGCGNGIVEAGEACDDGNDADGDCRRCVHPRSDRDAVHGATATRVRRTRATAPASAHPRRPTRRPDGNACSLNDRCHGEAVRLLLSLLHGLQPGFGCVAPPHTPARTRRARASTSATRREPTTT